MRGADSVSVNKRKSPEWEQTEENDEKISIIVYGEKNREKYM